MPTQVRLLPQQLSDLATIRDLGRERLQRVADRLRDLRPLPLRPSQLESDVAEALEGADDVAEQVLRPLLALCQLIRQREVAVSDLLEGLRHGIGCADPPWTESEQSAWESVEPVLQELFELPAVRTVSKAIDLAYEYANLFQGARLITDIRPVFNDDEELRIEGAVVSFTLRLHYDNREGNHSLSIALDEADVRLLQRQCERALLKAPLAQQVFEGTGVSTVISGDSKDSKDESK